MNKKEESDSDEASPMLAHETTYVAIEVENDQKAKEGEENNLENKQDISYDGDDLELEKLPQIDYDEHVKKIIHKVKSKPIIEETEADDRDNQYEKIIGELKKIRGGDKPQNHNDKQVQPIKYHK